MEASKCPKCGAGTVSDTVTGLGGGAVTYECRTRNTLHLGGIIETSSCLRNQLAQRDEQLAGVRRLYASEGLDLLEARRELAAKQAVIDGVRERAREAIREAYASGYASGHNDTADGSYYDKSTRPPEFYCECAVDEAPTVCRLDALLADDKEKT